MALLSAWPVNGVRTTDWDRMIQYYGLCEVLPDRTHPGQVEKAFREWALKRRLAIVEGENQVAFDPKAFNPKDSLDRGKFGFLLRYLKPRDETVLRRDLETVYGIRSMYVLDAIKSYWTTEGIIHASGAKVEVDREIVRLMGFGARELIQAMDGVISKELLAKVVSGPSLVTQTKGSEFGKYVVDFDILKERFFDAEFLLHAAGQPVPLKDLGEQMGVEDMEDLQSILREAKKNFGLNIEVTEGHVMFGAPSQKAIDSLVQREKHNKQKMEETEVQLKERLKTVKDLLDRYNAREAKIMNECEQYREEGRILWIKTKVVNAVQQHTQGGRK